MLKKSIFLFFFLFAVFINQPYAEEILDLTVLSEASRSNNYLSKLFAIDLLGDVADESYRNFFILALNTEKDQWIRYYAALSLSNLKMDAQVKFELKKMITDKVNEVWLRKKVAAILYEKTGEKLRYRDEKDAMVIYEPDEKNRSKKSAQKKPSEKPKNNE